MIIVPYQWQEIIRVQTSDRQELSLNVINRPLVWRLPAGETENIIIAFFQLDGVS